MIQAVSSLFWSILLQFQCKLSCYLNNLCTIYSDCNLICCQFNRGTLRKKEKENTKLYLLWVTKTLLTWPSPLQPGKGQCGSSCLFSFQDSEDPLTGLSFCLLAAKGQPEAVRWEVYLPDMWPWPSQPITGHLQKHSKRTLVFIRDIWWKQSQGSLRKYVQLLMSLCIGILTLGPQRCTIPEHSIHVKLSYGGSPNFKNRQCKVKLNSLRNETIRSDSILPEKKFEILSQTINHNL